MSRTAMLPSEISSILNEAHLLSANQIIKKLSQKGKKYNKTSVYRALNKLLVENQICKENFSESEAVYELRKNHHDHAVCTNCDKILAIKCHSNSLKKIPGFEVDHHHTTIFGLCDSCSQKT